MASNPHTNLEPYACFSSTQKLLAPLADLDLAKGADGRLSLHAGKGQSEAGEPYLSRSTRRKLILHVVSFLFLFWLLHSPVRMRHTVRSAPSEIS